jgi:hypothetical protein
LRLSGCWEAELEGESYKIWRNPTRPGESPVFMGDFYPPKGQVCLFNPDLKELGFPPGDYTVLIPKSVRKVYALPEWQKILVIE